MKPGIRYTFHHMGIPVGSIPANSIYSEAAKMHTADNPGAFRIQWHFFEKDSPLHPLIRTLPHPAFKVDDLAAAIDGEELLLGPYEPLDGYRVAIINDAGAPVELIQTNLSDEEIWQRAANKQGDLYRKPALFGSSQ